MKRFVVENGSIVPRKSLDVSENGIELEQVEDPEDLEGNIGLDPASKRIYVNVDGELFEARLTQLTDRT